MHELIKEIRAIAQTGLHYTRDVYDRERYQRLAEIANAFYAMASEVDVGHIERFFFPEKGYATPKVDLRACVIHEDKILLVRERSDGLWTLPGGWADQNESPIEGIVREVKEESGFDVAVRALYAVRDRDRGGYAPRYPVSLYKLFFTATIVGGTAAENTEISEVAFFDVDDLPPLSADRVLREDICNGYEHFSRKQNDVRCD